MEDANDRDLLVLNLKDDACPATKANDAEPRSQVFPRETSLGKNGEAEAIAMNVAHIFKRNGGPGARCKVVEEFC